nr:unnamed protein product [Callosobruchus chinensis]
MAECPVVPFFGAFLRELREILAAGGHEGGETSAAQTGSPLGKPPKHAHATRSMAEQQRQVVGHCQMRGHSSIMEELIPHLIQMLGGNSKIPLLGQI